MVAVWGAVAVVFAARRPGRLKAAVWIGAGLIATLVAISRVYLDARWRTDVVAGVALGGAWLCLLVVVSMPMGRSKATVLERRVRDVGHPLVGNA